MNHNSSEVAIGRYNLPIYIHTYMYDIRIEYNIFICIYIYTSLYTMLYHMVYLGISQTRIHADVNGMQNGIYIKV